MANGNHWWVGGDRRKGGPEHVFYYHSLHLGNKSFGGQICPELTRGHLSPLVTPLWVTMCTFCWIWSWSAATDPIRVVTVWYMHHTAFLKSEKLWVLKVMCPKRFQRWECRHVVCKLWLIFNSHTHTHTQNQACNWTLRFTYPVVLVFQREKCNSLKPARLSMKDTLGGYDTYSAKMSPSPTAIEDKAKFSSGG